MSFSTEWEQMYQSNTHLSIWPWSDLVSYVMRYARPTGPGFRVLELGCGAGANIPLFLQLGCDYSAIEGSHTMVTLLTERFPALRGKIVAGDFTRDIGFTGKFDLIFDRASLTHNTAGAIGEALGLVRQSLKPGGRFIGIDWFSTEHSDFQRGVEAEDRYTRRDIATGTFAGVGRVHFADRSHLEELFTGFRFQALEHKRVRRDIPADDLELASWNFAVSLGEPQAGGR